MVRKDWQVLHDYYPIMSEYGKGFNQLEYINKKKNQKIYLHSYYSRPNILFIIHVDNNKNYTDRFKNIGKKSGYDINNIYEAEIFMEKYMRTH